MLNIKDKVVIITGASSGIGEETAKELAQNGAKVVLAARRENRLKEIQKVIEDKGNTATYKVTDVTSFDEMESLAQTAHEKFGKVDVIVNNAGLMPLSFLNKRKINEWNTMIDVNIKGVLNGIGAVLPYMREQKEGHVVNISSVAGHSVGPGSAVYSGTKFAVRAITEGLRKEESASSNIRATIISPGAIETELTDHITDEDIRAATGEIKKMAIEPEHIARTIRFAIEQPEEVGINEMVVRPTVQGN
ncbi:SDR family oxidoreductase [Aquibacillus rhizosphaerae]|uniref:SDR family oxidoreductase n=1 Tax=Aquibacillus rhizosphaerae TaxID=3051431 RepID=A0ABT7LBD3_9BACI|nr:SDR family oxidoreductase [Aquibacillus sp. LR5S19]MDL4843178.1 SDR family oxidoreductase [Aquibacillus sp. LR5S19]